MLFFLVLGVLIGATSIVFALQNIAPVSVTFFSYHLDGSLAVVLFLTILSGMLVSILLLLPSFISAEFRIRRLKKDNEALETELVATKNTLHEIAERPVVVQTPPSVLE
jgi:uncharacterized integral membrane protein